MAKLYFYYSAMNAGKTTTLLQSNYNYYERGMETVLFTPIIDDRMAKGIISSRIGLQSQAIPFDANTLLFETVQKLKSLKPTLSCVFVDEAQFLQKHHVLELCDIVDKLKIPVLTYGLRTDFQGETFEGSHYLLALADELIEIKTVCHCGRKATMNGRMDEKGRILREGMQIEIGGNERYISLCRRHFNLGDSGYENEELGSEPLIDAA